jgi:hypothetical protein
MEGAMSSAVKSPEVDEVSPFEVGQVTEQIPAWELWEEGVEPAEDLERPRAGEKAA